MCGMFVFAVYNTRTREFFCARDFFGIKPFCYTVQNGQFIFVLEIKAILEHPAYERELNEEALAHLRFQCSALVLQGRFQAFAGASHAGSWRRIGRS